MNKVKVILFICLALPGLCLWAENAPTADESKLLEVARTDFSAGMFERAQIKTKDFSRRFPNSTLKCDVLMVQARAAYHLGQYSEALAALNSIAGQVPLPMRAMHNFWLAETLQQLEKYADAEKKYRDILALLPEKELVQSAQLGLAWALFKQNKEQEAVQLLATLTSTQGKENVGQKAALVLAKIQISKKQFKEANSILDTLLRRKPAVGVDLEAHYWMGEIAQSEGRYVESIQQYQFISGNQKAFPRSLVARAWYGTGVSQQKTGQHDLAMQAFEQAFTIADDQELKLASFGLYLQSAQVLQRLPEAQDVVRKLAQNDGSALMGSAALYAIGSSQAKQNQGDQAISTFEAMLTAYPDTTWRASVEYQLGLLYSDKHQWDAALKAFQTCLDNGASGDMQQQAVFKLGEVYFARNDLNKAAINFQKAAASGGATAEQALFNLALVHSQRNDLEAFLAAETNLNQQFPQSPLQPKIILERARLLERKGQLDKARQTYQDALAKNLASTQRPFFILRLADLLYDAGQYDESLKTCEDLVTNFPNDSGVPEATYKAIWCNYLTQRISTEQARTSLLALYKKYPQDSQAARTLFNASEFSFNAQDYVGAQNGFEEVATKFPQSELVDEAYFYAGRSAFLNKDAQAALEILEKVKEGSGSKLDARILQGQIYHQQLRFENAVTLFEAVLNSEKTGPHFVEASLRKGECLMAMGGSDLSKYEQAAAAFNSVLTSNQGNPAQRNQAAVTRAKCFEKINRMSDALAIYLDVLNGQSSGGTTPDNSTETLAPEMFWRVQAGLRAAELKQKDQDWQGALAVYKKLEQIGGPLEKEFRNDIDLLRREHFLYDDEH